MGKECEVVSCAIENPASASLHKNQTAQIHSARFPNDETTAGLWLKFLEKVNSQTLWKPTKKNMFICSHHFKNEDVRVSISGVRFIIDGRFPCIYRGRDVTESAIIQTDANCAKLTNASVHADCNRVILSQMERIKQQNQRIVDLEQELRQVKSEVNDLKRKTVRSLERKLERHESKSKRKAEYVQLLAEEVKKAKLNWKLPDPVVPADDLLTELIERRHAPKNRAFSQKMREFAFNCHYISPKAYSFLRQQMPEILPDGANCYKWTKDISVSPGMLKLSLQDIRKTSTEKKMYYSLSFDEMAIRQQILFNGNEMVGRTDYGGISQEENSKLAKSALFCLATEINGRKSFPIAYILTDGLKSDVLADVVCKCLKAVDECSGNVLSISFDGLKANFTAMEKLGAKLSIASPDFEPLLHVNKTATAIIPDASHMFKLVRNTWEKFKVIYNGDNQPVKWEYIQLLHTVQEEEQLRAANKLTKRHLNFQQKKMNVKLAVQTISRSTAVGIDFSRKIGMPGFENSEATTEFIRINDYVFDIMNTKPFGKGKQEALSKKNKLHWSTLIISAKKYYLGLKVYLRDEFTPLHETKFGTFVRGIVIALTSIENIMGRIETGQIELGYLPTYRLSQDQLEIFFGGLRRRLGNNDNPNVLQLAYSVRAMLCFKLSVCRNGNCDPQESLQDRLDMLSLEHEENICDKESMEETKQDYFNLVDLESYMHLSLFGENIVAYIAGFVGMRLQNSLGCEDCAGALLSSCMEEIKMREDYTLIFEKDLGGLVKPSEELVHVCKIAERIIRIEQCGGIFKIDSSRIKRMVIRECLERNIFSTLHLSYSSSAIRKACFQVHSSHKLFLITEICNVYSKVRLHYIAKRSSLQVKPVTNRCKLTKLVHFTGN